MCCRAHVGSRPDLFPNVGLAVALLDAPATDRIERRRPQRRSGPQAEAGVVPGTADRVLDQHPVAQWTMIMSALGADREQLLAAPRQQHRFARGMTQQHAAVGNVREGHTEHQVGPVELFMLFAHRLRLPGDTRATGFRNCDRELP